MAVGPFDLFALDWIEPDSETMTQPIVTIRAHGVDSEADEAGCEGGDFLGCPEVPGLRERLRAEVQAAIHQATASANERLAAHAWRPLVAVEEAAHGLRLRIEEGDGENRERSVVVRVVDDERVLCEYHRSREPTDDRACPFVDAGAWHDLRDRSRMRSFLALKLDGFDDVVVDVSIGARVVDRSPIVERPDLVVIDLDVVRVHTEGIAVGGVHVGEDMVVRDASEPLGGRSDAEPLVLTQFTQHWRVDAQSTTPPQLRWPKHSSVQRIDCS